VPVTVRGEPLLVGFRVQLPVPPTNAMVQLSPMLPSPSETVTLPVGVPVNCGLTVAVTVVVCPNVIEFDETLTLVVLVA